MFGGLNVVNDAEIIVQLKVIIIWLNNLRNEQDLKQAIEKIQDIIKVLEK